VKRPAKIKAPPVQMKTYIVRLYLSGKLHGTGAYPTPEAADRVADHWRSNIRRTATIEEVTQERRLR
jgi:hypothetical protein